MSPTLARLILASLVVLALVGCGRSAPPAVQALAPEATPTASVYDQVLVRAPSLDDSHLVAALEHDVGEPTTAVAPAVNGWRLVTFEPTSPSRTAVEQRKLCDAIAQVPEVTGVSPQGWATVR